VSGQLTLRRAAEYAFSVLIVSLFAISGVYAFRGAPFGVSENAAVFERPEWSREIDSHLGFPAYRLRDDGSALAVGRIVMLNPEQLRITVFPDVNLEPVARSKVVLMRTNGQALWALVPEDARLKIAKEMERVVSSVRDRFVAIVRDPAFDENYRRRLQDIVIDAYDRLRVDRNLNIARDRAIEIYRREYAQELTDTLLLMALPRLREAALEMMSPSWQEMMDLVTQGKIDLTPLADAAADLLRDTEFFDSMVLHGLHVSRDRRFWRLGVVLADAFIDEVSDDPRTEELLDDMARDPAFRSELQLLEREAARATTTVFTAVVGRGPEMTPDTLAVRIIRYIVLRRPHVVAVILPSETPDTPVGLLRRYEPLVPAAL
jgi:hypothetical protein